MLISNSETDTKLKKTRKEKVYNNKHNFFLKMSPVCGNNIHYRTVHKNIE